MTPEKNPILRHCLTLAVQGTFVVIPVVLWASGIGAGGSSSGLAVAQFSSSDPPSNRALEESSTTGGGGDAMFFRLKHDNLRNRWTWSQSEGWKLDTNEQTYSNGWRWIWKDGQWQWEQDPAFRKIVPQLSSSASVPVEVTAPSCFDVSGGLTEDRAKCALDQRAASMLADPATLPEPYQSIVRDTATYVAGEEAQVLHELRSAFDGDVRSEQRALLTDLASDVVRQASILKNLDSVTDAEKDTFVRTIAAAQKVIVSAGEASTDAEIARLRTSLVSVSQNLADFIRRQGIQVDVQGAPSAASLLAATRKVIDAIPAVTSVLEDAGYSTANLRSMHSQTLALYTDVSVRCAQGRQCSRIRDVVDQVGTTVAVLNDMVFATGDPDLKAAVDDRFSAAMQSR